MPNDWLQQNPQAIRAVAARLERDQRGCVRQSLGNCLRALTEDPFLAGMLRLNLLSGRPELTRPLGPCPAGPLTDAVLRCAMLYLETHYNLHNEKKLRHALYLSAQENAYHPVRDRLSALVWDGEDRLSIALPRYLGAEPGVYTTACLRLFMLGAAHRVFSPGCKFETMLCLSGGQGAGKSTFFRFLALQDEWFTDDLRSLEDRSLAEKLQGHWIVEMSEMLATSNARNVEEIKSFLSRQKDVYRQPYDVYPEDRPRQCAFGGTTNRLDFLPMDRSGNRRFLPVRVYAARAERHLLSDEAESRHFFEQLWAQVMEEYRAGDWTLTLPPEAEEILARQHAAFARQDDRAGLIAAYMARTDARMVCSRQLYREALGHAEGLPTLSEQRAIYEIVTMGIENGEIVGWKAFFNPRHFPMDGRQKG